MSPGGVWGTGPSSADVFPVRSGAARKGELEKVISLGKETKWKWIFIEYSEIKEQK